MMNSRIKEPIMMSTNEYDEKKLIPFSRLSNVNKHKYHDSCNIKMITIFSIEN